MHVAHVSAAPDRRPSRLGGPEELAWSLRLLATTGIHVSLVRVDAVAGDPALALDAARLAFGGDGVYAVLGDGAAAVLLVDTPADRERADAAVQGRLGATGFEGLEVSTYHAFADEMADADDALQSLALMPRRRLTAG